MKKLIIFFLSVVTVVVACLSFAGCSGVSNFFDDIEEKVKSWFSEDEQENTDDTTSVVLYVE